MDYTTVESEFMRPLVEGWLNKIEACSGSQDRKHWKEVSDECMMFYSQSAKAMWSPEYSKKFWKGVKLPKFRITINKAFEMVAIFGPNLFWEIPHRNVEGKRSLDLPPELFGDDQEAYQQIMQQVQQEKVRDQTIAHLMDRWLNYTPREQPGGGLANHSLRSVVDGLIKGRGIMAPRPYKMPGSGRTLTGAFREAPESIYLDPDFCSVDECRWMAIRHIDTIQEVESRFGLPKDSLKNKATLNSSWVYGEEATDADASARKKAGVSNDLVVWYEIFSKSGLGVINTNMESSIREHFDRTVGQYAYICVCATCPYPLNMPTEAIRRGASDEDVYQAFQWPVPFWADDRWPVEMLDFYIDPESAYPVPPLAPGLGELKLLNFLMSWFANRVWSSSRDFWAVAQPHLEHYREYLMNSEDQSIIPTPTGMTPKEAIEVITQPETRQDMTALIGFVSDMFDKRVGLTPTIYGQNENSTQNRTAEETMAKNRAVMARPEYMQKQVVDWQSRIAQAEAFVTRLFVTPEDVGQLLGPIGSMLWQQHVTSTDVELVVRQFNYTIGAASIRRPNRERDIGNYQQVMNLFAPVLAQYGQTSGNYEPWNGMVQEWGRLHDTSLDEIAVPPPDPEKAQLEQQAAEIQMQQAMADLEKTKAETQSELADAQKVPMELQVKQAEAEMKMQEKQMDMQAKAQQAEIKMQELQMKAQVDAMAAQEKAKNDQLKTQGDLTKMAMDAKMKEKEANTKQFESTMDLAQNMARHDQEMDQDQEVHEQEIEQMKEKAKVELEVQKKKADADIAAKRAAAKAAAKEADKPKPKPKGDEK